MATLRRLVAVIALSTLALVSYRITRATVHQAAVSRSAEVESAVRTTRAARPFRLAAVEPKEMDAEQLRVNEESAGQELDENDQLFEGEEESTRRILQRARERTDLFSRWDAQSEDETWTGETKNRIMKLLVQNDLSVEHLRLVDCRETMCRIQFETIENTKGEVTRLAAIVDELTAESWLRTEYNDKEAQSSFEIFLPQDGYHLSGGSGHLFEVSDDG